MKTLLAYLAIGSCAVLTAAENSDIAAPVVAGGGTFTLGKPEMHHRGWIDLNKNGAKDAYEDPALPTETRVADLLARMSREERVGQLLQKLMTDASDKKDAALVTSGQLGSFLGVAPDANLRNRLQRLAVEETRLGIPLIFGFDTIHGFRTTYPIPLGLSCSWDTTLVERLTAMAALESTVVGVDWTFAPMVDIARDPRWGRIAEGNGEDPYLGGLIAAASVRGFQGNDYGRPDRVVACLKHYVGYGAAEGGRDYNTTEIGLPTLRHVYLPPFRAGVEAGAGALMAAFNSLNGVPASGSRFTLDQVLRREWGFGGFVVGDWESVGELVHHGYAADKAEAGVLSLTAGVDMEMVSECYRELPAMIDQKKIDSAVIDEAVRRILRVKFKKGLFDRPYTAPVEVDVAAHRALAREAVAASCVLLKNEGAVLPLDTRSIAIIGPFAEEQAELLGCWHALGNAKDVVSLHAGLKDAVKKGKFRVARGCPLIEPASAKELDEAVKQAKKADVVILALGEPALWAGENNHRLDLGLPGAQQQLFDRIVATGKPVVTVLFAGRPLAIPAVLEKSAAVLMAWHPGIEAGHGVADVLTGKVAPTARLTTSFPRSVGQVPVHYNHLHTSRPFSDYKDGTREALLPFGFGLTYTTFTYGPTRFSRDTLAMGGAITISTTLTNTGKAAGTETAQLYLHDVACLQGARPVRELKGFQRVTLAPGESREVSFTLRADELGSWSPDGKWVVEPGRFEATIAPNAASGTMAAFTLQP